MFNRPPSPHTTERDFNHWVHRTRRPMYPRPWRRMLPAQTSSTPTRYRYHLTMQHPDARPYSPPVFDVPSRRLEELTSYCRRYPNLCATITRETYQTDGTGTSFPHPIVGTFCTVYQKGA